MRRQIPGQSAEKTSIGPDAYGRRASVGRCVDDPSHDSRREAGGRRARASRTARAPARPRRRRDRQDRAAGAAARRPRRRRDGARAGAGDRLHAGPPRGGCASAARRCSTAPYEELWIGSWDEIGERLLREHSEAAGLDPFFDVLGPAERLAMLLDRFDQLPLRRHEIRGNPAGLLARLLARIDALKAERVGPTSLAERAGARPRRRATKPTARRRGASSSSPSSTPPTTGSSPSRAASTAATSSSPSTACWSSGPTSRARDRRALRAT